MIIHKPFILATSASRLMAEDHLQSITECPDCASQNIVHGTMRDQIICRDCGLIFEPFAAAPKTVPVKKAAAKAPRKAVKAKKPARKAKPKKAKPKKAKKKKRFGFW